eukprot:CAMPEP_0182533030 /NCGR_PEP_ID=MMETSP1323-20130603/12900_1 /TAXON_ID=236787 /ORGANISM="Florenciella parvula, Strain RCC1693" /LENGTH=104 /DNA_ID=CAMNT_0024742859 /DNA_START=738 /DNA_END=1048 /DNA_ORIENTATION=+
MQRAARSQEDRRSVSIGTVVGLGTWCPLESHPPQPPRPHGGGGGAWEEKLTRGPNKGEKTGFCKPAIFAVYLSPLVIDVESAQSPALQAMEQVLVYPTTLGHPA